MNEWNYWERLFDLAEKIEEESFKETIELFSKFLVNFDLQYQYNETFLPLFSDEFLLFIKYFRYKFPIVKMIIKGIEEISNIKIMFDKYWKYEYKEKYSICENTDFKQFCSKTMRIECSLLVETKRFLFRKEINISKEEEIDNIQEEIAGFIENTRGEKRHG